MLGKIQLECSQTESKEKTSALNQRKSLNINVTAAKTLSLNSCHHVTAGFLARVSNRLAAENAGFRMRITLGVVLIRSLVCFRRVPGRLRSVSGVALK